MIDTYTKLQQAMTDWGHRSDLASHYPDFISLCEAEMFRELELRITEATVSGTTTSDTITIPSGLARVERLEITLSGVRYTLDYTPPDGIERLTYSTSLPTRYTVENNVIRIIPAPASAYAYTLYYIPDLTALSSTVASNWALTNAPDCYLYGSLEQLHHYSLNTEEAAKYRAMFEHALDAVKRSDESRRFPLSGGLQIKVRHAR